MNWVVVVLLLVVLLVTPNPLWWNIRLIDFLKNFFVKGLHIFKIVPLDQTVCRDNLFVFDDVMREVGIHYWLSEGTALGCVRDSGFIPWDDDVDTGMMCHDKEKFVSEALPRLRDVGFTLTMVTNRGTFFGLTRNGEKVDVDFVCPETKCQACRTSSAKCETCDSMVPYLHGLHSVEFLGRTFVVPGEDYLDYLYGPTWRIPDKKKDIMI